jgi:hypothetical protein
MGVIVAFAFNLAITEHCGGEQDTSLLWALQILWVK